MSFVSMTNFSQKKKRILQIHNILIARKTKELPMVDSLTSTESLSKNYSNWLFKSHIPMNPKENVRTL